MATPVNDSYAGPTAGVIAGGRFVAPDWAPAAGEIKQISRAAGYFGTNGGATLAEIDPANQAWNPEAPAQGPYKGTEYYWGSILGYSGVSFNSDTRQLVVYGAGHASINVCAPFCFDLNDLRWKWLDVPPPFDGFKLIRDNGLPEPPNQTQMETYYPPEQYDYSWGDVNGSWAGWEAKYGPGPWLRPGKIFPVPSHNQAFFPHIPAKFLGNAKGALLLSHDGGTGILSGINAKYSHLFDFDAVEWSRNVNKASGYSTSARSAVVHASGKVFSFGTTTPNSTIDVFDPATRTWSTRTASNAVAASIAAPPAVMHHASDLYIVMGARTAGGAVPAAENLGVTIDFYAIPGADIVGTGAFSFTQLVIDADSWPLNSSGYNSYVGFSYCPVNGCLYAFNGVGGSNKYWKLTPPASGNYLTDAWQMTEHTFSTGTLTTADSLAFSFNRLTWDKKSRSFIWFTDSINGPVQAFRPHGV